MKLDRIISILVVLLRKERVSARELADMFEVSTRTILRDIEAINLAGIPVITYQGIGGGISIAEGYRIDKSLLTQDEMLAILSMLKGIAKTIPGSQHEILIEKFKNTLSPSQLSILDSRINQLVIDLLPWGEDKFLEEKKDLLQGAIKELKEVEFEYIDAEGNKTRRRTEPYSLVLKGQKWYLYGWCSLRKDFRLFKLTRMKEISVMELFFKPREVLLEQFEQFPWEKQWQNPESMIELELIFSQEVESIIMEWLGKDVVKQADGSIMVKTSFPENNWLYGFLLSFGTSVEVINPPHIRNKLAEIAQQIFFKYSSKT